MNAKTVPKWISRFFHRFAFTAYYQIIGTWKRHDDTARYRERRSRNRRGKI
jgi:hypothetical protein